MEITKEQYEKIEKYLPVQRGNVNIDNLQLINAILYVVENGIKWRKLPKKFGSWHTVYVRFNRWSKQEVLDKIFIALQTEGIQVQKKHSTTLRFLYCSASISQRSLKLLEGVWKNFCKKDKPRS